MTAPRPMHPPRPEPPAGTPTWTGGPVRCGLCSGHGRPVHTSDGWRLPLHSPGPDAPGLCPNSLAGVPDVAG